MTSPVFHHDHEDLRRVVPGEALDVVGPEARHAVTVRRLRAGELLDLVDGHGVRVSCTFTSGEKDRMRVTVDAVHHERAPRPHLGLVQALAKGDRDLQAAESATELGVVRVVPWQAERSIVRLRADRAAKTMSKWEATLGAAAKQSRRAHWPQLQPWVDTAGLAQLIRSEPETLWLLLHESAVTRWCADDVSEWRGRAGVTVVVGPEGGISDRERDTLEAAGAHTVRLGETVMRSSTAGQAALAALSAVLGIWG